ncbi:hypothetical protein PVAP13_1NG141100 [Panicum virgatum]|uniref:Uncharacterized protein n=1 Tax=Panicum virgatum TaxID=38727 RepID=A0A8T0X2J3_PANVG|nr:hypothetical protein PVAP13_1NG141100 [Panicum virgatum]KAG2649749.1 hypothetical protein PVAP13_1NG141100 [Panicum virgatum]
MSEPTHSLVPRPRHSGPRVPCGPRNPSRAPPPPQASEGRRLPPLARPLPRGSESRPFLAPDSRRRPASAALARGRRACASRGASQGSRAEGTARPRHPLPRSFQASSPAASERRPRSSARPSEPTRGWTPCSGGSCSRMTSKLITLSANQFL